MKIELSNNELKEAIKHYLADVFKSNIENIEVEGSEYVICDITLGSEENPEITEEIAETKPKRTRRKAEPKQEESEPEEEKVTHYSNLPSLTGSNQEKYIEFLSLLNNNPINKNRKLIEKIIAEAGQDLLTVIQANQAYKDWAILCEESDAGASITQTFTQEQKTTEPVDLSEEPENEPEETPEEVNLRLMKEVLEEDTTEPVVEEKPIHKPLFSFNKSVNQSGSLFPAGK